MKRIFVLLISFVFVSVSFGQLKVANEKEVNQFFRTKTLVVLTRDMLSDYDNVIQETVKEHWTITPYDFIEPDEFEKYAMKDEYSFLVLSTLKVVHKKESMTFKLLNLVLGGVSKDLNRMPDLGSVPVIFEMYDMSPSYYKLASVIQFTQKNIQYIRKHPDISASKLIRHYNDQSDKIHSKELWLQKEELEPDINTIEKIKDVYPHKVKIVTSKELKKAIDEQREDVVFLYKIAGIKRLNRGNTIKMLMSTQGDLYYINQHSVNDNRPDALLKKDLRKIR